MATPKQQYAAALRDIAKRYGRLDHNAIRQMIDLLQETRKGMAAILLDNPTDFQSFRLRQLTDSVDVLTANFQAQLSTGLRDSLTQAQALGIASVNEPLRAAGVDIAGVFNVLSPAQVNVVNDFSAALVKDIGEDLRKTINGQLRLSTLAQQTPFEAMKNVTKALGIKATDGVWGRRNRPEIVKGVAARAETIVRTEMTRIYNLSNHSQQQTAAEVVPGLLKQWIATPTGNTRDSHLNAHIRYANNPIPVDEPFEVGGELLMYPGDPAGSPAETINCRCTSITVVPEIGTIATPLDKQIADEKQRRKDK